MNATRICSVDGCESRHDARGYCASHYNRWKRYGDPRASAPKPGPRLCEVEDCGRPHRNWGYCNMHGQRFYKHGDPLKVIDVSRKPCQVDGCETLANGHGYCVKHLRRVQATGDPHAVRPGGRPLVGEHPGWDAAHKKVSRKRGKAAAYSCVDCGGSAKEWSYDNADPNQLVDSKLNLAYSLDPNRYAPRCVRCHRGFDARNRTTERQAGMALVIREETQ